MPDLADLNEGDLKYKVDFKNVYATVLNKWLNADDKMILGNKFSSFEFYINLFHISHPLFSETEQ